MSEISKCPCCGSEQERAPRYNKFVAWTCSKCYFTCNNEDLVRIAAAMELAKAAVWREVSDYGSANAALSGSNAYVDKFLRVLEVFGK